MKVADTISSMLDDLQLDIALWIHERIYEFSSPSHYPISLRNHHDIPMRSVGRRKEERQQLKNRQRNRTRTLSLPLFKEEM